MHAGNYERVIVFHTNYSAVEIGVITERQYYGLKLWCVPSWPLSGLGEYTQLLSRSDDVWSQGPITVNKGAIFNVFLSLETQKLSIYHNRSRTTQVLSAFSGTRFAITST